MSVLLATLLLALGPGQRGFQALAQVTRVSNAGTSSVASGVAAVPALSSLPQGQGLGGVLAVGPIGAALSLPRSFIRPATFTGADNRAMTADFKVTGAAERKAAVSIVPAGASDAVTSGNAASWTAGAVENGRARPRGDAARGSVRYTLEAGAGRIARSETEGQRIDSLNALYGVDAGRSIDMGSGEVSVSVNKTANWNPDEIADHRYVEVLGSANDVIDQEAPAESMAQFEAAVSAVKSKSPGTYAHMVRVGFLSGLIALRMGFPVDVAKKIKMAAQAHDIGKIETTILKLVNKAGALSPAERVRVKRHTQEGARAVQDSSLDAESKRLVRDAVLYHHETWNGRGYYGLRGEAIPLVARITEVADVFDALVENRPYHRGVSSEEAVEIMSQRKEVFDPVVWDHLLGMFPQPESGKK